ncbi:rhodanese-like domain-containing protein [uncultured Kriegella sp.]|uniref:rhodanese-like domain-containing protein n=1 Tax=uncultured Kriegella sp. TaxID=1798910 RepID=UPI0030DA5268|tara:strand:- start:68898 stop:69941 length:1044 start_codon:yes stop_codon:yes gene_type:complete
MNTVSWKKFEQLETLVDIRLAHEYAKSHVPRAISLPFPINLKKLKKDYGTSCHRLAVDQLQLYVTDYKDYMESLKSHGSSLGLYGQGRLRSYLLSKIIAYPVATIQLQCGMGNRKALSGSLRNVQFLEGGFNSYLDNFYARFETHLRFIKICGLTGSGKTHILREIRNQGGQVVDLEQLAKHSGSTFGGIAKEKQPYQWKFEQELLLSLEAFNANRPVFIEEKGTGIGSLHIPLQLSCKTDKAQRIFLEVPTPQRINNLVKTYGGLPKKDLEKAITNIIPRLGKSRGERAIAALKLGNLQACAAELLDYYDRTSVYSQQSGQIIKFTNMAETAQAILHTFEKFPIVV